MKTNLYTAIAILAVAGYFNVGSASAQTSRPADLTANIPFEFSISNKTLPAGEYIVTTVNPSSPNKVLHLRPKTGGSGVMVQTTDAIGRSQNNPRLVFRHFGGRYFLAEAWMASGNEGLKFKRSRAEKELERTLGGNPTTSTIAMCLKR